MLSVDEHQGDSVKVKGMKSQRSLLPSFSTNLGGLTFGIIWITFKSERHGSEEGRGCRSVIIGGLQLSW
jgi:hypothetical protein